MVSILGKLEVQDFAKFISVFATCCLEKRREYGCEYTRLYRVPEDTHSIFIVYDWSSADDFRRFLADPNVKAIMKSGTVTGDPQFTILSAVGEFAG